MLVNYGGWDFELEHIKRFDMRSVYSEDGVDFLYNHITLGLVMAFNPAATSALIGNEPGGFLPAVSVARMKQGMLMPRLPLKIVLGDDTFLESPQRSPVTGARMQTDCKNGPNPIRFQILHFWGIKTFLVYWEVECYVNDGYTKYSLLSHRWEETQELDALFYTTRIIQGRAVFRNDQLVDRIQSLTLPAPNADLGRLYADDYRSRLLHTAPPDFKLEHLRAKLSSDGTTLDYVLVHKQQPVNIKNKTGIVKWAGKWEYGVSQEALHSMPVYHATLSLRAWGNRSSTRASLQKAMIDLLAFYGIIFTVGEPSAFLHYTIRHDLWDRMCEVSVTYRSGGILGRLEDGLFGPGDKRIKEILDRFPEADEAVATLTSDNPVPPLDFGTRSASIRAVSPRPNYGGLTLPQRPPVSSIIPYADFDFNDAAAP